MNWESGVPGRMERDWDGRARSAPEHFIATAKQDWTQEDFFRSGEENVKNEVVPDLPTICHRRPASEMRVLEIGCGAGRMTRALAGRFGEVHGVDISAEMIDIANANLSDFPNVVLHKNSGTDLAGLPSLAFDFAFSFIVFQHVPSLAVIASYAREVYRCLKPGSLFKFQVQGDQAAASSPASSWNGVPVSSREAHALAERCGFEVIAESGEGTQYYWLWFWKPRLPWVPRPVRAAIRGFTRFRKAAQAALALLLMGEVELGFSRESVKPGGRYAVTLPELAGFAIDVAYEFTATNASAVAGVVVKWCKLDDRGRATITVPPDTPAGMVHVTKVRAHIVGGQWRRARGRIEVARA